MTNYEEIKDNIVQIYQENQGQYGHCRITLELRNRDHIINHKTVQKLMKKLNFMIRVKKKSVL